MNGYDNDVTKDKHMSQGAAIAVGALLRKEGFGGERKIFPICTSFAFITFAGAKEFMLSPAMVGTSEDTEPSEALKRLRKRNKRNQ